MQYRDLQSLAGRIGATGWLGRMGLKEPVRELARLVMDPTERQRRRIIWQDFQGCQDQFRRIASGVPAGDPGRIAWIICSMPTVWGLKLEGMLSLAVRLADFCPAGVHLSSDSWARRYHGLFKIDRFTNFERFRWGVRSARVSPEIEAFTLSRPRIRDLLALTYRQVDIGRIALSNVLSRRKFVRFDVGEPGTFAEVCEELVRVQRNVLAAERMIDHGQPKIALLLEKGLSPAAEIFGACVARGIPVVQYTGSHEMNSYILRRFALDNRQQHPFSLDAVTWQRVKAMPWGPRQDAELMTELEEGYKQGTWFRRKFLHESKQIKKPQEVRQQLDLDPAKKTAVIFSHVLWDATFFYGEALFDDYETWLVETVRAASANPRLNWVVKLHPDLVWKLKYYRYGGELRDLIAIRTGVGILPGHVKLVPPDTDISTYSFFDITDVCITVRGTIGIEMACRGVPVLTAGTGRYSGLGFTIDSASAEEYLRRLAHIQFVAPMPAEQIQLARRFAYALFKLRPWPTRSFEMVRMAIEKTGHPLDHNVIPRVENFDELARAPDMRQLADWVASGEIDYLGSLQHRVGGSSFAATR